MDINNITIDQVSDAYIGRPGCMCGCKGNYYYTQAGMDVLSEDDYRKGLTDRINPAKVLYVLRLIQAAALDGKSVVDYDPAGEWVTVDTAKKRYAIYLLPS